MAEFVAVLDKKDRFSVDPALDRFVVTSDSTVVGVRVDDGSTLTHADYRPLGKPYERCWRMPDELAFATEAFFDAVYANPRVEGVVDCHAYVAYALGLTPNMARSSVHERPLPYRLKPNPVPSIAMLAWKGYLLERIKEPVPGGVHSLIAMPRRNGVIPECIGVTGVGGNMVVAKTRTLPHVYAGQQFHRILGADTTSDQE